MRYLFLIIAALFLSSALNAQVRVNLNFNIGTQPVWGPTGYDYVEYYYLPDIDAYYYVPQHRFYYNEGGRWISRSSLPSRYGHYDLYNSYKVVVNDRDPWRNDEMYRQKYASYKGRHDQQPIRDSHDSKYFVNKNHPEHNNWVKQQKNDKGNVNRIGNNNGNGNRIGNNNGNGNRIGNNNGNGNRIGNNNGNGNRIGNNNGNVNRIGNNNGNVNRIGNTNNNVNRIGNTNKNVNRIGNTNNNVNKIGNTRGNVQKQNKNQDKQQKGKDKK
jgi:hypothetical protein